MGLEGTSSDDFSFGFGKNNDKYKDLTEGQEPVVTIPEATETILRRHSFVTLKENDLIYVYKDGVYVPEGEVVMKQVLEELFGYQLNRSKHAEIREHIRNKTYKSIDEFDADLNIINMNNGLYNIQTGELMPHTFGYISLNKKPIVYDPDVPVPSQFITFLRQIVYPSDLRTVLELMAYTFHRANPFEILTMLFGIGGNGKGVLFGVLEGLHGAANVSNVSLKTIIERSFGLYDLVGKDVNLDNELSSTTIYDSAILKKITGRQPTRVEQKNQKAFDAKLHAKLWFSANKIPDTVDDTNAFFRRVIIIATPNTFSESTPGYDPYLQDKLTTPESLAGIFNLLAPILRCILANRRIYLSDKHIPVILHDIPHTVAYHIDRYNLGMPKHTDAVRPMFRSGILIYF